MVDKIVNKLLSGKFWLTMMAGVAFMYAVYARIIPSEAVASIVTMVFVSYFTKNKDA